MVEKIQKERPDDWRDIKLISPAPADDIEWLAVSPESCGLDLISAWRNSGPSSLNGEDYLPQLTFTGLL